MFVTKSHYHAITQELSTLRSENERLRKEREHAPPGWRERLEQKADDLSEKLLAAELELSDVEWAARLGYLMLRSNSTADSLAGRVAVEIARRLKGKTEFVGLELGNPLVLEIRNGA